MSVMDPEGYVKDGQARLTDRADLPEEARVHVVVADTPPRTLRTWSPRLADSRQIKELSMVVTETSEGDSDAEA